MAWNFSRVGFALSICCRFTAWGLEAPEEAAGVNLSLEEGFGARYQGMATRFSGYQTGADAVGNAPAGMADVNDLTFSSSHTERFAEQQMDHFAALFPLDAQSTLGLGLARYGVSQIDWRPVGSPPTTDPLSYFSTADYWITSAYARRIGPLDLGASLQMLYRDLDQSGLGLRADVMGTYNWSPKYRFHALLTGALPSTARWSSGYAEYENPDLRIGAATLMNAPYFYGHLQLAWETEGLFQKTAKSSRRLDGYRGFYHPLRALETSNLGAEFLFDFGLALRFGLDELELSRALGELWHAGLGYTWRNTLGIDYSYHPHPYMAGSHQVAVQFTPVFPHFSGKGFRGTAPAKMKKNVPSSPRGLDENHESPEAEPAIHSPVLPAETPLGTDSSEVEPPIQPTQEILEE